VPHRLVTALAATSAIIGAIVLAGIFSRSTSDAPSPPTAPVGLAALPGAIVYSVTVGRSDVIYIRDLSDPSSTRVVASFPVNLIDLHVRGATSPAGSDLAVLYLESGGGAEARLSLINLQSLQRRDVPGTFDYLSRMAWSPDGERLVLTRKVRTSDPSRGFALVEVEADALTERTLHVFENALALAPIGFGADGRLLAVVVSQEGSSLWAHGESGAVALTRFSPGLTSDWALSPDGDRVAFIDHIGVGNRNRAGRILAIATGKVTDFAPEGEQLGATWRPGSPVPDFGGPDGSVGLAGAADGAYLVPIAWTPDGRYLVATVVDPSGAEAGAPGAVEIVSAEGRVRLAEGRNARFLGLVPRG
jgi:hypothetical protein